REDFLGPSRRADASGDVDAPTRVIAASAGRLRRLESDPERRREAVLPAMANEPSMVVDGRVRPMGRMVEGHEEAMAGGLVALGRNRLGEVETSLSCLVRQVGRLPEAPRLTENRRCLLRFVLSKEQFAAGGHGASAIERTVEVDGDLLQFLHGTLGGLQVTGGEGDINLGRQQPTSSSAVRIESGPGRCRKSPG